MSDNAFPDALPPQSRLHWYVIERVLGQGGFGITYLARDTNLDQSVALKEYLPVEVATRRPDAKVTSRTDEHEERYRWGLERFIREARTLARFDHPNIVRVLSVFELNNTAYMVMRFEEGETLAAALERRHALGETDLMRVLLPILDGLELVHHAGFIHRDIKPDNIHIRSDGTPVLLDFGSARHSLGHSRTVTILVAPGYAPFEQYYSSGENQGPWTDIYSLGATCYRAIAGRAPLDAIARSKGILGSTQEILVPASAVGGGRYSERLLKAVDRALSFAEKDRPQSIAEWRKELTTGAAPAAAPSKVAPPQHAAPRQAWSGARAPLVWGAVGGMAVIVAIAVVPWLASGRREPPPQTAAIVPKTLPEAPPRTDTGPRAQDTQTQAKLQELERKLEAALELQKKKESAAPPTSPAPKAKARPERSSPDQIVPRQIERTPGTETAVDIPAPRLETPPSPAPVDLLASAERAQTRGNYTEAAAILKQLVERGNARAMVRLGDLHLTGLGGVERSDELALRLFRGAAELGNSEGQQRLGDMYVKGRGVPQNNLQAYIWLGTAARSGNTAAKTEQERIAATLQAVEIKQAEKLIDNLVERLARAGKEH